MLQSMLVKRVERVYRWRMLFVIHLAVYGMALIALTLTGVNDPARWTGIVIALWLPLMLAHTAAHTLYELRERCVYQPQPAEAFRLALHPVDLYDEQGNRIPDESTPRLTAPR